MRAGHKKNFITTRLIEVLKYGNAIQSYIRSTGVILKGIIIIFDYFVQQQQNFKLNIHILISSSGSTSYN